MFINSTSPRFRYNDEIKGTDHQHREIAFPIFFESIPPRIDGKYAMDLSKFWSFPAIRYAFALASGTTYALAYPPLGAGPLIYPAVFGLLWVLRVLEGAQARAVGFLFGMAAFGTSLSWLYHLFGWFCVVLWMVLAMFPALFAEMQWRALKRGLAGWEFTLFTAINWSAWEFIRAEVFPLKFPWMTVGQAVGPNPLLPWIGVYGVGFIVLFCVALLAKPQRPWLAAAPLILFFIGGNIIKHLEPAIHGGNTHKNAIHMAALQFETVSLDVLIKETRALPDNIDWVVWPEYAVPYDVRRFPRDWKLLNDLVTERDITLTFGTQADDGDGWRNIALTLDADGVRGEHTKVQTVHLFDDGTPGTEAAGFNTRFGIAGTPICFDCDYEGVVRRMTAGGAEFIISPIMDAMNWSARQHDQHAELFRIRACENRRWIFVAASSGISQVIDPYGRLHGRLDAMEQDILIGTIHPENPLTFYTRYGWLFPRFVLAIAAISWVLLFPICARLNNLFR